MRRRQTRRKRKEQDDEEEEEEIARPLRQETDGDSLVQCGI